MPTIQRTLAEFSRNYAEMLDNNPESAQEYFAENFLVRCFGCGGLVKPVKPMNCPVCGTYLD